MNAPIFAAEQVAKSFGQRKVLQTAGVWAHSGRITAVLGRNGTGKSTLLKIAVGQLRADRGVVIYKGDRSARPDLAALARNGLYYLPERGVLSRWFSVKTHLDAVASLAESDGIESAIEQCRLSALLERPASKLSGGERRRSEIGLVVARQPDCLLADEPLFDLSPTDTEVVSQALRHLAACGCAMVVTGHEVEALLQLADEVVWITAGTTHALGTPTVARAHDQFRREYLGGLFGA